MRYIGIDIGSLFLKAVIISENYEMLDSFYKPHFGDPLTLLLEFLDSFNKTKERIGFTGSALSLFSNNGITYINLERAIISRIRHDFPNIKNIIDIGGSSIRFIELTTSGNFKSYSENSLCAAGTGSFLDEQANRMEINYEILKEWKGYENPPKIASRCAVFAKSDLIHCQQEGWGKDALWSGLCKGLSSCIAQTLLKGRKINGNVALTGGVSQNLEVIKFLQEILNTKVVVPSNSHLSASIGAALAIKNSDTEEIEISSIAKRVKEMIKGRAFIKTFEKENNRKPLELRLSRYPSFDVKESYKRDDDTEVRIISIKEEEREVKVFAGIDIGSTSTKIVLIDENENLLVDIYRKTKGEPIEAVKKIFKATFEIEKNKKIKFNFSGVGTTGSGRKMIGKIIGADVILNEITAHAIGALKYDPEVETIFEIGGQDSKYIRLKNGNVVDSNMNYVCAAGTGSFVEEVANKLGYKVSDVGDEVMGVTPPKTSDRCTVFMEQDVIKLIQDGYTPKEALAGVIHSVTENYLHKVVGRRAISKEKISFMGATARNKGIVAAFEKKLEREIVVSSYCHVLGAFGVSIAAKRNIEQKKEKKSSFIGLDFINRKVELKYEECPLCSNSCKITYAYVEGLEKATSWGYMCGREPDSKKMKINEEFKLFTKREKLIEEFTSNKKGNKNSITIGIPFALQIHDYQVFYQEFLTNLGFNVKFSRKTNEEIKEQSASLSSADFCFPAKLVYGHLLSLIKDENVDFIFYPHTISEKQNPYTTNAHFCPIIQGMPKVSQGSLSEQKLLTKKILTPVLDFRLPDEQNALKIYNEIKDFLKVTKEEVLESFKLAIKKQNDFRERSVREGEKILNELQKNDKTGIVFLGRSYNLYDTKINVELPQKFSEYGFTVIPTDFLPFNGESLGEIFKNMYWNYGQKILSAAREVKARDNLFAVYLTNFNCGPDSFVLSYVEEIMGDKPLLILELDEHGADAGYITRIEAFINVINELRKKKAEFKQGLGVRIDEEKEWQKRRLWIPPMHPIGSRLFAASFRAFGFKAEALPQETYESYEIGRGITRGSECLPTVTTIGVFAETMRKKNLNPENEAFFMPTTHGPCRFGQYKTAHLLALKKEGLSKVAILSPSTYNSYQGLPENLRIYLWHMILISDILLKMACKIRPYEVVNGATNHVLEEEIRKFENVIEKKASLKDTLKEAVENFLSIPIYKDLKKPLVGIVGEIYVRCNLFSNENVIESVEKYGGEAWLAPTSEWFLYTSLMTKMGIKEGTTVNLYRSAIKALLSVAKDIFLKKIEHKYYEIAKPLLFDRMEPEIEKVIDRGKTYIPVEFRGESILTIGRATLFIENGADLVINTAPFSCMPGTLTSAALLDIQQKTGVPVVSIFYDGEGGQNRKLEVFLKNIRLEA